MHEDSLKEMSRIVQDELKPAHARALRVLDVGSRCVNTDFPHTYRELMPPSWTYLGADLEPGLNVDLVMAGPYSLPARSGRFDLIISGQVLKHVKNPFRLLAEMARALNPGGTIVLAAPWRHDKVHDHPVDCWRILPAGMRALLEEAALKPRAVYMVKNDTWAIADKNGDPER